MGRRRVPKPDEIRMVMAEFAIRKQQTNKTSLTDHRMLLHAVLAATHTYFILWYNFHSDGRCLSLLLERELQALRRYDRKQGFTGHDGSIFCLLLTLWEERECDGPTSATPFNRFSPGD